MALLLQTGCVRLPLPARSHGNGRRFRISCTAKTLDQRDTVDWVKATNSFFEKDSRPIMLFDGVCNLCNGGVKFVTDNDSKSNIRFEALQSEEGRQLLQRSGRSPDDISSVVLVEKDRSYIKSDAVLKIMELLDAPYPQLAVFFHLIPLFIRDVVYEQVSNNRYSIFGRSDSDGCEIEL